MTAVILSVALVGTVLVALAVTLGLPAFALALVPLLAVGLVARLRFLARRRAAAGRSRRQAEPERVPGVVPPEIESDFWDTQPVPSVDWANAEPDLAGSDGSHPPPASDEPTATVIAYDRDGDQIWPLEVLARVIQNQPGAEPVTPRPLHWRNPDAGAQPVPSGQPRTSLARGTEDGDEIRNREPQRRVESSNSSPGIVNDDLRDLRDLIAQPFTQCAFRRWRGQSRDARSRRCPRRA